MAYIVGLTGGIGSGKSTVSALLVERGAIVLDADAVVHELQRAGESVFVEMVDAFGPEIVGPDGELDRPKVASIVFSDEAKREQLQKIVHPKVGEVFAERIAAAGPDDIVVMDIPLLTERQQGSARFASAIIVVDASETSQLDHLVVRGMSREDALARMAAQATREERLALADHVVDNNGSLEELEDQVDELWVKLVNAARAASAEAPS